jgi:hypothetical protein
VKSNTQTLALPKKRVEATLPDRILSMIMLLTAVWVRISSVMAQCVHLSWSHFVQLQIHEIKKAVKSRRI